jgi:predicted kinase
VSETVRSLCMSLNLSFTDTGLTPSRKSWTIRNLAERGYFPVHSFVTVDPDDIRRHLPEFDLYVAKSPQQAGDLTRKEAGYIAETLTEIALQRGHNVLVDGTLKDHRWYSHFFATLREQRPNIKIAILHITAPRHAIMERAKQRAHMTGRVVPRDTIELAMREVPKSVEILAPRTDFYAEIYNAPETPNVEMRTEHISWEDFTNVWTQTCSSSTKKKIDDCLGSTRECEAPTLRSVL